MRAPNTGCMSHYHIKPCDPSPKAHRKTQLMKRPNFSCFCLFFLPFFPSFFFLCILPVYIECSPFSLVLFHFYFYFLINKPKYILPKSKTVYRRYTRLPPPHKKSREYQKTNQPLIGSQPLQKTKKGIGALLIDLLCYPIKRYSLQDG